VSYHKAPSKKFLTLHFAPLRRRNCRVLLVIRQCFWNGQKKVEAACAVLPPWPGCLFTSALTGIKIPDQDSSTHWKRKIHRSTKFQSEGMKGWEYLCRKEVSMKVRTTFKWSRMGSVAWPSELPLLNKHEVFFTKTVITSINNLLHRVW
jgi:hypothetical protein